MDITRSSLAEKWRDKISKANILDRLLKDLANKLTPPLTPSQITLGIKLIGKILPDLQSTTVDIGPNLTSMTKLELESRMYILGLNPTTVWESLNNQSVIEHVPELIDQNESLEEGTTPDTVDEG